MIRYQTHLKRCSQALRNNQTEVEKLLWSKIRRKQLRDIQFYRQKPIANLIADFYGPKAKLIIEVDGSQHYEDKNQTNDIIRDARLKKLGLKVLRFTNLDILKNINGVLQKILDEIS